VIPKELHFPLIPNSETKEFMNFIPVFLFSDLVITFFIFRIRPIRKEYGLNIIIHVQKETSLNEVSLIKNDIIYSLMIFAELLVPFIFNV